MRTKIYISGPITNDKEYIKKFNAAQKELEEKNYAVINPAVLPLFLPEDMEYEELMAIDMFLLSKCDAIYMLKGWEESRGANREYGYALAADMVIICQC